jgi:hypothetical protein
VEEKRKQVKQNENRGEEDLRLDFGVGLWDLVGAASAGVFVQHDRA